MIPEKTARLVVLDFLNLGLKFKPFHYPIENRAALIAAADKLVAKGKATKHVDPLIGIYYERVK
jgi:hypothetical protein